MVKRKKASRPKGRVIDVNIYDELMELFNGRTGAYSFLLYQVVLTFPRQGSRKCCKRERSRSRDSFETSRTGSKNALVKADVATALDIDNTTWTNILVCIFKD